MQPECHLRRIPSRLVDETAAKRWSLGQRNQRIDEKKQVILLTREAVVIALGKLLIEQYWDSTVLLQEEFPHMRNVLLGYLNARPSIPEELHATFCEPAQTCGKSAR